MCAIWRASANLAVELREALGIRFRALGQELERHRLAEPQVVGAIHLAHAAAAEAGRRCGSGSRGSFQPRTVPSTRSKREDVQTRGVHFAAVPDGVVRLPWLRSGATVTSASPNVVGRSSALTTVPQAEQKRAVSSSGRRQERQNGTESRCYTSESTADRPRGSGSW